MRQSKIRHKPYSNEDFEAAVNFLRQFARERSSNVWNEVVANLPQPSDIIIISLPETSFCSALPSPCPIGHGECLWMSPGLSGSRRVADDGMTPLAGRRESARTSTRK